MRFADPSVCPDCRAPLGGADACRRCGLDLATRPARELWQTLLRADTQLAAAREASGRAAAPAAPPAPAPVPPASSPVPTAPAAVPAEPRPGASSGLPPYPGRPVPPPAGPPSPAAPVHGAPGGSPSVSVGSVLLGLGAFMIVVAAVIFVSVAWSVLGAAGRCAVMLVVTLLVGVLAALLTRRGLRASAESVWVLVLGLVTVDWFAAFALDLLGLSAVPVAPATALWSLLLLGVAVGVTTWARRGTSTPLVGPPVVAAVAACAAGLTVTFALTLENDWWLPWAVAAATLLPAVVVLVLRAPEDRWARVVAAAGAACGVVTYALAALVELVERPGEVLSGASGVPLLLLVVVLAVGAVVVARARTALVCAAAVALAVLVLVPLQDASPGRLSLVVLAVLALALAAVPARPDGWSRGLRLTAVPLVLTLALAVLGWWAQLVEAAGGDEPGSRLASSDPGVDHVLPALISSPWWAVAAAGAGLAGALVLAGRSPELPVPAAVARCAAAVAGALAVAPVLQALDLPVAVLAAATVVGLAVATWAARPLPWPVSVGLLVVAALATLLVVGSDAATFVVWCLAAVVLGVVAYLDDRREPQAVASGLTALALTGAVPLAVSLGGGDDRAWTLAAVLAGAVALGASLLLDGWARPAVQAAAVPAVLAGLAGVPTLGWSALVWTVLGASLVLVSLRLPHGRWWRLAGAVALGVAWVQRLAASDVEVVEAYTAPFAAVLLAAGVVAMRSRPALSSEAALAAGLTLALLPSLPLVLVDPASVRGLLLGLVSLALLLGGLWLDWRAPLVAGAAVLALVTLANLGVYALVLPRWLLLALGGALLLGVGITWEASVRQGRVLVQRLSALR